MITITIQFFEQIQRYEIKNIYFKLMYTYSHLDDYNPGFKRFNTHMWFMIFVRH